MARHSPLFRRRNAALLLALAAAGCGGTGASSSGDADSQAAKDAAAVPMTEAEYQALLDSAGTSVARAVADARKASGRDKLAKGLEKSAATLEETAGELDGATAPENAGAAHAAVQAGMLDLAAAFTAAADKVESGGLCTAPAAVAQVTRSGAAGDLRGAAKDLRASGFSVAGLGPKRQAMPARRLKSGVLFRAGGSGPGKLVITNGNPRDGVVKITTGNGKRMSIYVRGNGATTVDGIPDGKYKVYFATGNSWDGRRNTFSRNCGFTKFDDTMKFTSGGGQYTQFTITLNAVAGGNAPSSEIDPNELPRD